MSFLRRKMKTRISLTLVSPGFFSNPGGYYDCLFLFGHNYTIPDYLQSTSQSTPLNFAHNHLKTNLSSLKTPESEISNEAEAELDGEAFSDRLTALRDMIPPSARRQFTSSISCITSFTKSSVLFSGKALWVISTTAFLLGVPWALAYAEEEQYVQLEREQGMIRGANEV